MQKVIELESFKATEAKNRFGDMVAAVTDNKAVSLLRHGKPSAYLISPKLFDLLDATLRATPPPLLQLERDFDDMIEGMQQPESVAVMQGLMSISASDLRASARKPSKPKGANVQKRG